MASQRERKRESVKPDFAASRTTRTPDRVSQNEGRPATANATTKRDSHDEKEKRPSTAADNTRTSVGKLEHITKEDFKGLKTICEEMNYKEECQLHSNIEPQDSEERVLKRKQEHNTKHEMKELENLCKDLKEKDAKELQQPHSSVDLQDVDEHVLKRLSTIASDRLTHENANIADLSDENRPTKLQEVYGELYDNEWTDAFEELKTHMNISDKDAIVILLKIIMDSFHNCREITWSRYEKFVNVASSIYIEKKTPIPCTEKKRSEEETTSANGYNDGNPDEKKEDNIKTEGAANGETVCRLKTSAHDTKTPAESNMTTTSPTSVNSCNEKESPKHNETSVDQNVSENRDEKMKSRTEKIDMTSAKSVQSSKDKEGKENKETSEDKMAKCSIELNVDILHAIKDIWKTTSFELKEISAQSIYSVVATNLDMLLESMPKTSKYLKSCADLCWRMGVQERLLHLEAINEIDVNAGKKFDKDKLRHFTQSGEKVDYVVWPALYRYEGGPLILKGIAQGC